MAGVDVLGPLGDLSDDMGEPGSFLEHKGMDGADGVDGGLGAAQWETNVPADGLTETCLVGGFLLGSTVELQAPLGSAFEDSAGLWGSLAPAPPLAAPAEPTAAEPTSNTPDLTAPSPLPSPSPPPPVPQRVDVLPPPAKPAPVAAPPSRPPPSVSLDSLRKTAQLALMTAAQNNELAVSLFGTPVLQGAWLGCTASPYCNLVAGHKVPCSSCATIPAVSAYRHLLRTVRHDDSDSGDGAQDSGAAGHAGGQHGSADSSAACSGRHGSTATHHEEGDHTSSVACDGRSPLANQLPPVGLTLAPLPPSLPAPAPAGVKPELALDFDMSLPASWLGCPCAHPLADHCPGATNIQLLEDIPEEGPVPSLGGTMRPHTPGGVPGVGGPGSEHGLADVGCINAAWQPQPCGDGVQHGASHLPSSFIVVSDAMGPWDVDKDDVDDDGPAGADALAWPGPGSTLTERPAGAQGPGKHQRRSVRATRSMPNFRSMVMGVERAPPPPSGGMAAPPPPRVIIHRWPNSGSGASQARRSRVAEDMLRASFVHRTGQAGADGSLAGTQPLATAGSTASLADLTSSVSGGPSTNTGLPQQLAQGLDGGEQGGQADAAQPGRNAPAPPPPAPRHSHNLRGRQPHQQAPTDADAMPPLRTSRLPEVPPPQTHGGRKRGSGGVGSTCARPVPHPSGNCCTACGTTVTPVWRAGPQGPKTLCNACGVRYMKVAKRK